MSRSGRARTAWRDRGENAQAGVELLGALPVMLVLALFLFQALAVGYSAVLAGNAAEAGAISLAGGGDAEAAARRALPGWSEAAMGVAVDGGRVEVSLRPPSPIEALRERLRVTSAAAAGGSSPPRWPKRSPGFSSPWKPHRPPR